MLRNASTTLEALGQADHVRAGIQVRHWVIMIPEKEKEHYVVRIWQASGSNWDKLLGFLAEREEELR